MALPYVPMIDVAGTASVTVSLSLMCVSCADIYFHQRNADEHHAALELRDAVLRLRRDGAFVAVPLFRVNTDPIGPHPVGMCMGTPDSLVVQVTALHAQVRTRYGALPSLSTRCSRICA